MQKTDAIKELIDRNLFPPWTDKQTSLSCLSAFACDRHLANWLTFFLEQEILLYCRMVHASAVKEA